MNSGKNLIDQNFEPHTDGLVIDYKRIIYRAIRYWYVVLLSLIICCMAAYLINRYSVRTYLITSSILIGENENTTGGASILYNNPLLNSYQNYLNEPYIIKSYPIVGSVIKDLNFDVTLYKEGNVKTTEIYDKPVEVHILKPEGTYGVSFIFTVLDENTYSLSLIEGSSSKKIFYFNDSTEFHGAHFVIQKKQNVREIKNIPLILTFFNPVAVAGYYIAGLNVSWAEEGSGILNLSITGDNPNKQIDFINHLIEKYQAYDLEKKNQTAERTVRFIKEELKVIADSLNVFEDELIKFKIENSSYGAYFGLSTVASSSPISATPSMGSASFGGGNVDDVAARLYDKLNPLETQRTDLSLRSHYFDYIVKYIKENKNLDMVVAPSAIGMEDEVVGGIVSQILEIQLKLKLFAEKGKLEYNPIAQDELKKLDKLKSNLLEAIVKLRVADKLRMDTINSQIAEIEKLLAQLPIKERKFIALQRNYSLLEGLYVYLLQKLAEASITKASNISNISVVNPPMTGALISPKTTRNYAMGVFAGLALPILAFVLIELLNQNIQSKDEIGKYTTIPFLGIIGHNDLKSNLAANANPKSAVAESFRSVRSNLNYFTGDHIKKVFMITSSISGEGKTFSTINLATIFAMSGRKTLIIGADMRKPKIYGDFNLSNHVGLSGYLSQLNTFSEVVQPTSVNNLDLISGGPVPPNPSELLISEHFEQLIQEALNVYDYIIIDTPPLAIVADAFAVAKFVNHTIFVVRQNYTPRAFLKDIQEHYSLGKIKDVSIVLNDTESSSYGYGYGYVYGRKKHGDGYYS